MPSAVGAVLVATLLWQGAQPLKKSDLIRLLSSATLAPAELADLIRRNCLTFTPSPRDRADLRAMGADATLMRRIDDCARPVAAPSRTGFVSGVGQRGRVGTRLPLPIVFEARDTTNAPVIRQTVTLAATNARLEDADGVTDSMGRVRAFVVLGERAGPARIAATLGRIEREVTFVGLAGPPAGLVVRCGAVTVDGRVSLATGAIVWIDVGARDEFGNPVTLTGLRVNVGDQGVVQAGPVAFDSVAGRFSLRARKTGATNLVVLGSGIRESLVAAVSGNGEPAGCRAGGSPG